MMTRLRNRRKLVSAAVIAALLGAGGAAASRYLPPRGAVPPATVAIARGDVEKTVTALGKLKPKNYVDVGTQVSGQLKKVHVRIGERVRKGDLLAEIDAAVLEAKIRTSQFTLDSQRAQMRQQQAELVLARQRLERNQALLQEEAVSAETVEQNQTDATVAVARVAATQAQLKATQASLDGDMANLGYTRIYAPMSGTLVSQTSMQGQTVNASQQAPVIARVADLDTMTIWAQVAEADVLKIKPGMKAYFSTLNTPDGRAQGTVRQVLPTPEIVSDVVLYNVLVDIDNRGLGLMTDMTAQVFFVLAEAADVPLVPLNALQAAPDGAYSARVANLAHGAAIEQRTVRIGVASRTMAQVVSGLAAGERVVLPVPEAPSGSSRSKWELWF
jgi:macrolide-specific efflux system membrane fusion protein